MSGIVGVVMGIYDILIGGLEELVVVYIKFIIFGFVIWFVEDVMMEIIFLCV